MFPPESGYQALEIVGHLLYREDFVVSYGIREMLRADQAEDWDKTQYIQMWLKENSALYDKVMNHLTKTVESLLYGGLSNLQNSIKVG